MGNVCTPSLKYCFTIQSALKWLVIIFTIIIYCLLLSPHNDIRPLLLLGEEFTIACCTVTMLILLIYLIAFSFGCDKGVLCDDCPCNKFGYVTYFLLMVCWFIAGAVETYATTKYLDMRAIDERYQRRASAAAFCYANGLIFLVLMILVKFVGT